MAALVNASAVAKALAARTESILIACAGTEGNYASEDALCAGIIASRLLVEVDPGQLSLGDGARIAIAYAAEGASHPKEVLTSAAHGKVLASLGMRRDLALCSVIDSIDLVPMLKRDPLRLALQA
jgi:2-phosphosulfolactate phosphatase